MESAHPLVVHFPIALLITAFLLETLAILLGRPAWPHHPLHLPKADPPSAGGPEGQDQVVGWHRIALWNLGLGTLGALAAVISGRMAGAVAKHSWEIHQVMELHERLGYAVLSLAIGVTGLRVFLMDRLGRIGRRVSWLALGLAVCLIAYAPQQSGQLRHADRVDG